MSQPDPKTVYVEELFRRIAPKYDLMNSLMSLGQDVDWRTQTVRRAALHPNASLLDLGTGTGRLAREALAQQPRARVTAADLTLPMMQAGRQQGDRFQWMGANALHLPFAENSFHAIVSGFLMRNVTDHMQALREQYRVLKPRGRIVILDTTRPRRHLLSPLIWLYLHVIIPVLGRMIARHGEAYTYLVRSTEAYYTAEQLAARMAAVGFKRIGFERFMFDTMALHWAEK